MSLWLGPVLSVCKERLGREETDIYIKREDITIVDQATLKDLHVERSENDGDKNLATWWFSKEYNCI